MTEHPLDTLRLRYEDGDQGALLDAIALCADNGLPLPQWCASAFCAAYMRVKNYKLRSWDEAFGKPHPARAQLPAAEQRHRLMYPVWKRVTQLHVRKNKPIDGELFEVVGEEFHIGKTRCSEYYYAVEERLAQEPTAREILLSLL